MALQGDKGFRRWPWVKRTAFWPLHTVCCPLVLSRPSASYLGRSGVKASEKGYTASRPPVPVAAGPRCCPAWLRKSLKRGSKGARGYRDLAGTSWRIQRWRPVISPNVGQPVATASVPPLSSAWFLLHILHGSLPVKLYSVAEGTGCRRGWTGAQAQPALWSAVPESAPPWCGRDARSAPPGRWVPDFKGTCCCTEECSRFCGPITGSFSWWVLSGRGGCLHAHARSAAQAVQ